MQISHIVHAVSSVLMMAMFAGHIYMATLGVPGAMDGMRTGYVDESWAKEHHEWWYDDVKAGKIPAQRSNAALPGASPTAASTQMCIRDRFTNAHFKPDPPRRQRAQSFLTPQERDQQGRAG